MIRNLYFITIITLLVSGQALAASSSASYKITSEIINAGAASGSSTSFKMPVKAFSYQVNMVRYYHIHGIYDIVQI